MSKVYMGILFYFCIIGLAQAQNLEVLTISIVSEVDTLDPEFYRFEQAIKNEINTLLKNRRKVVFKNEYCHCYLVKVPLPKGL